MDRFDRGNKAFGRRTRGISREYITSMKPRLEGSSFNMLKNNYSFRGDTEFAWRFEDQIAKQLRKRDF